MRYSSCVSRFITRRVVLSCWLAVCLLAGLSVAVACCPMGTLCAGWLVLCAARGRAGICLFSWRGVVLRGAVLSAGLLSAPASSARPALLPAVTVLLPSLSAVCQSYGLPSVIRSALACFGCAALALRI